MTQCRAAYSIYCSTLGHPLFTQALSRLLANPGYIEPLRQEVEAAVAEEGWTKAGLDKMYKVDSFLRDSTVASGWSGHWFSLFPSGSLSVAGAVLPVGLVGLALRPFTFSNGITVLRAFCVREESTYPRTLRNLSHSP